jgi:hypothetical protein
MARLTEFHRQSVASRSMTPRLIADRASNVDAPVAPLHVDSAAGTGVSVFADATASWSLDGGGGGHGPLGGQHHDIVVA